MNNFLTGCLFLMFLIPVIRYLNQYKKQPVFLSNADYYCILDTMLLQFGLLIKKLDRPRLSQKLLNAVLTGYKRPVGTSTDFWYL